MTTKELKSLYSKDELTGCWLWSGPVKVWYGGKAQYPHRLLWSVVNKRDIPIGTALVRVCETDNCISPSHHTLAPKHTPLMPYIPQHATTTTTTAP